MDDGLNGRRLHHWRGKAWREGKRHQRICRRDRRGRARALHSRRRPRSARRWSTTVVNFASLKSLITKHLCGVRVVQRDGRWEREYFSYEFPPPPRLDPRFGEGRGPQEPRSHEPASSAVRSCPLRSRKVAVTTLDVRLFPSDVGHAEGQDGVAEIDLIWLAIHDEQISEQYRSGRGVERSSP
jgi:hypothetical protein